MSNGVFQIDRAMFENKIWNNIAEFRIFFYLIGNAVWKEEGIWYGNIHVRRGQYLKSYRQMREDLMYIENNAIKYYSISTIKRITDKLQQDGRIIKEETGLGTLYTIVNYEKYQGFERFNNDNLEQRQNSGETALEQRQNKKKKDNNDNKDYIYNAFFEEIWRLYPNKKGKGRISNTKKKELYKLGDEIKRCISRYIEDVEERRKSFPELKYQNGSTFFNSGYVDYLDTNYEEPEKIKTTDDPYAGLEFY